MQSVPPRSPSVSEPTPSRCSTSSRSSPSEWQEQTH
jgi:hypothetical protein